MSDIQETLRERNKSHGDYREHAAITQTLKNVMQMYPGYSQLRPTQVETLHMVAHKIGRILAGNPNEPDHWRDIAGYAMLVANELETGSSLVRPVDRGVLEPVEPANLYCSDPHDYRVLQDKLEDDQPF